MNLKYFLHSACLLVENLLKNLYWIRQKDCWFHILSAIFFLWDILQCSQVCQSHRRLEFSIQDQCSWHQAASGIWDLWTVWILQHGFWHVCFWCIAFIIWLTVNLQTRKNVEKLFCVSWQQAWSFEKKCRFFYHGVWKMHWCSWDLWKLVVF